MRRLVCGAVGRWRGRNVPTSSSDGPAVWRSNSAVTPNVAGYARMESTGNMVLYHCGTTGTPCRMGIDGTPYWNTATSGNPGASFIAQSDGTVVIRDASNKLIWWSAPGGVGRLNP